ncbi:mCG141071 [Mus musculus]|nr:mCG141071 [Mus musculus]
MQTTEDHGCWLQTELEEILVLFMRQALTCSGGHSPGKLSTEEHCTRCNSSLCCPVFRTPTDPILSSLWVASTAASAVQYSECQRTPYSLLFGLFELEQNCPFPYLSCIRQKNVLSEIIFKK